MRLIDFYKIKLAEKFHSIDYEIVIGGENISTGSNIQGLASSVIGLPKLKVINLPNSENTHFGFGYGAALAGKKFILFVKQLDFIFLGLDHLINTHRQLENEITIAGGSFTVITLVCDQGSQGPQSSYLDPYALNSITGLEILYPQTKSEVSQAIEKIDEPGVRIISLSQRTAYLEGKALDISSDISEPNEILITVGTAIHFIEKIVSEMDNPLIINFYKTPFITAEVEFQLTRAKKIVLVQIDINEITLHQIIGALAVLKLSILQKLTVVSFSKKDKSYINERSYEEVYKKFE